jgi:hypothetical protein
MLGNLFLRHGRMSNSFAQTLDSIVDYTYTVLRKIRRKFVAQQKTTLYFLKYDEQSHFYTSFPLGEHENTKFLPREIVDQVKQMQPKQGMLKICILDSVSMVYVYVYETVTQKSELMVSIYLSYVA